MNLYEVIFWSADECDNDEDTIYLVRAAHWRAAVEHVHINASPSVHKIHRSTLAHRVHEIGTDAGAPQEQILRGPYFQCAYNHGWRSWSRQLDQKTADYTSEWKEEPHAA
jgi:hypothetical protein